MRTLQRPLISSGDTIRRRTVACLLAGAALAAGGCGESPATSLSAGRAARWHDTIAGIRAAAAAADRPTALAALTRLSGYVARDAQAGQLAAGDAAALKAGIAQARRHLPQPVTVPAAALAVRTPPPPPPPIATTRTHASETTTTPAPAAEPPAEPPAAPPAAPPASSKGDEQAQKDAAKAQKESLKAQKDAAKQSPAKPKAEKVKTKGDK